MSGDRRAAALLPALVLAVTVVELVAAVVAPADQFDGKGWGVRLVVYPALMLLAPTVWWATRGRTGATEPPYAAFTLLMLPFLSDTTANWLDLFRDVGWWDDLSHFVHWFLSAPASRSCSRRTSGPAGSWCRWSAAPGRCSRWPGSWGSTGCSSGTARSPAAPTETPSATRRSGRPVRCWPGSWWRGGRLAHLREPSPVERSTGLTPDVPS